MDYQKIHDSIINAALMERRSKISDISYQEHHILPKCEGGNIKGATVLLTLREHYIVHKLRYKITGNLGNLKAYTLMKYSILTPELAKIYAKAAGLYSHVYLSKKDPELYTLKQRNAGKSGGRKCVELKLGFHSLSADELLSAQVKGRETLVKNKIGMFSDEFRLQFRKSLFKKIHTPDGEFNSMMAAAEYYKMSCSSMTYRVNNPAKKWADWYYMEGNEYE